MATAERSDQTLSGTLERGLAVLHHAAAVGESWRTAAGPTVRSLAGEARITPLREAPRTISRRLRHA